MFARCSDALLPSSSASSTSSASSIASFSPPTYGHLWNLLLSLPVLLALRTVANATPYARQGFFCQDIEIRYPYVPDTVPADMLDWVYGIVALITVICTECTLVRHLCRRGRRRLQLPDTQSAACALALHPLVLNCAYFVASVFCSLAATSTICNLGKRTCSRLRPNFLAVCQPRNLSALCPPGEMRYIGEYECTNTYFDQNEYFAFPSGHSATVCNFTVFIVHYLQKRCKLAPSLRSFGQFFAVLFAYFVCLSRVRDHKHRLADVAGGALVGIAVGVFFVFNVLHNFRPNRYTLVEQQSDEYFSDFTAPPLQRQQSTTVIVPATVAEVRHQQKPISDYGSFDGSSDLAKFGQQKV